MLKSVKINMSKMYFFELFEFFEKSLTIINTITTSN